MKRIDWIIHVLFIILFSQKWKSILLTHIKTNPRKFSQKWARRIQTNANLPILLWDTNSISPNPQLLFYPTWSLYSTQPILIRRVLHKIPHWTQNWSNPILQTRQVHYSWRLKTLMRRMTPLLTLMRLRWNQERRIPSTIQLFHIRNQHV